MTVVNGKLTQLSVSEVEKFEQCQRAWWFERANELRPDQSRAQEEGEAGHEHLALYLSTGEKPTGRKLMGKAASGAIVKGDLPKPGHPENDLLVELRFSGQEKFTEHCRCGHGPDEHHGKLKKTDDKPASKTACTHLDLGIGGEEPCECEGFNPEWIPLDTTQTLHLGGVPWEGFIDLAFRRGDVPEVWDHKFFSPCNPEISDDPYHWLKKPSDLIKTVQMPVYAKSQMPFWPDAKRWRLVHHCVSKKGVDSLVRSAVVTTEQINARCVEIEATVELMKVAAGATDQKQLTSAPRRVCESYGGCPHQSVCSAYQEKPTVQLSPEEAAMFDDLDAPAGAPATPAPAAAAAASEPDPFDGLDIPELDDETPAAAEEKPKPRMKFIDTPAEGEPVPQPVASPSTAPAVNPVVCKCETPITSENGSKLQDGTWKHIGCKLDAPPPAPVVARARPGKKPPKTEPAPKAEPTPEEVASKLKADAEEEGHSRNGAVVEPVPAPTAPVKVIEVAKPAPVVEDLRGVGPAAIAATVEAIGPNPEPIGIAREANARIALAETFEGIAKLLRSVA